MKPLYGAVLVAAIAILFVSPAFAHADGLPVGGRALIVQDHNPWGYNSNQLVLDGLGVSYDIKTPTEFSKMTLSQILSYHTIIWPSQQYYQYQIVSSNIMRAYMLVFVIRGGHLVLHVTPWGSGSYDFTGYFIFPMGLNAGHVVSYDGTDKVVGSDPILSGVPSTITSNYASHGYFTGLPSIAHTLITDTSGRPVYFTWSLGSGKLYATMMTMEWQYGHGFTTLLYNELYWATR
jgi:hypothetical protein